MVAKDEKEAVAVAIKQFEIEPPAGTGLWCRRSLTTIEGAGGHATTANVITSAPFREEVMRRRAFIVGLGGAPVFLGLRCGAKDIMGSATRHGTRTSTRSSEEMTAKVRAAA